MDLTWRDAITTLALALILVTYGGYLGGGGAWPVSSAWATAAVIMLVGIGGHWIGVAADRRAKLASRGLLILRKAAAGFSVLSLLAGLIALATDSAYALKIQVMTSIVVWAGITVSHICFG